MMSNDDPAPPQIDTVHCIVRAGVVTFVSSTAREVGGWTPEQLQGRRVLDLVHPDDHDGIRAYFEPGWEGVFEANIRVRSADGAWNWRSARGVRTLDSNGSPSSVIELKSLAGPT